MRCGAGDSAGLAVFVEVEIIVAAGSADCARRTCKNGGFVVQ